MKPPKIIIVGGGVGKDEGQPASCQVRIEAYFELGESRERHQHQRGRVDSAGMPH
ncbi:MAG: hypothetical protein HRF47_04550 [Chloroflexota bacterium]|jgi:hypothetical protein